VGKTRVCGKRCHTARRAECRCWCGGLFHGAAGREARDAFAEAFKCQKLPSTEHAFDVLTGVCDLFADAGAGETWRSAVTAAVTARDASRAQRAAARASGGTSTRSAAASAVR
jgi:hypothetical protein